MTISKQLTVRRSGEYLSFFVTYSDELLHAISSSVTTALIRPSALTLICMKLFNVCANTHHFIGTVLEAKVFSVDFIHQLDSSLVLKFHRHDLTWRHVKSFPYTS